MAPPVSQELDPNSDAAVEEVDWRYNLLRRIRIVVVVLVFLAGATVFIGYRSDMLRIFGACMMIFSFVMAGLLWSRSITPRAKSFITIVALSPAAAWAYLIIGYLPGPTLGVAFILVAALLLIDRRAFVFVLLAFTLYLVGLMVAITIGAWQGPQLIDIDPSDPTNWIRTSLITVLLWASIGFSVSFVVDSIERNLARRKAALESLKLEIAERQAAETARREAETVANQAQKLEAVGHLAAGIAHDFNNALLVIQGWNEIRANLDTTEEQRRATHAIQQAAEHTAQLSHQLLMFARKDVRTPRYIKLDQLVEQTMQTLRHIVGARIEIHVQCQRDTIIHADEAQIQQVLLNLVINARDAIDGQGNIRISVRNTAGSEVDALDSGTHRWVTLEVEDDGHGMNAATQERVFEPFFTTKTPGKGTGLGLSTVFGIVQRSGGSIDLQSRPGCTRFSIYLPSADIDYVDSPDAAKLNAESVSALRVLVIEDDRLARQLIVLALERNGNEVVECADGDSALATLREDPTPFDLLCSDAVFPGEPLETVLEAFEKHSPDAKVLICSGYVQQELTIRKLESGEYAFLAKPFSGRRLIARIHEILLGQES